MPNNKTSSMIVNLGALPPCLASSSSWSIKSLGSNAILLPPAKALPAWWDVDAWTPWEETLGDVECCRLEEPLLLLLLVVFEEPFRPQASPSSSSAADEDAATRRRWRPPEDMSLSLSWLSSALWLSLLAASAGASHSRD